MLTEARLEMLVQIVESVFATMMDMQVTIDKTPLIPGGDRLMSFVPLTGAWNGAVQFECSPRQACQFTGRFLSMNPPDKVDADVVDALGELANMIGGNLKCAMPAGVHLALPSVADNTTYDQKVGELKIQKRFDFRCAEGHFWVSILSPEGKP